jgi:PAS domain S-box-containing protein
LDLSGVLRRTVEAAVYVADAEEGMLMLLGEQEKKLHLRAVKRPDDKEARELRAPVAEGPGYDALHAPRHILLTGDQALGPTGRKFKALLHLPLRVADRRVIGVLGVANQETERVFSERDISLLSALADSVAVAIENARLVAQNEARRIRQASLLQNAQDAIILTDEHGRILTCNEATGKILDSDPEAVKLRSATKALPHPVLREMFAQVKESGQPLRNELLLEDGQTFNTQLTPVEGVGFILVMQDITHLKELDELKSGFVFALTHDLRTPLTTTQGYLDLLPKAGPVNEEQHSFIGYAQEGIHTITKLLDEVMEIGSIEAGARVEMIPCDLREVITSVVEDLRPRASEKRQELRWNPPDALPLVKGNRGHLCQAMSHLVNNAIKYTPRDGHIVIEVGEDEGYAVVRVSDDGIGIPLAHQTRIFDQFYRIDSAETIGIKGMGLGLAIVKVIIENHNGRVWVDSKPGMGSTFSFVLPALPEAPGRPEICEEDSPPA